jgi:type IV secretion system protein VirB9
MKRLFRLALMTGAVQIVNPAGFSGHGGDGGPTPWIASQVIGAGQARAEAMPRPGPKDSRIQYIPYQRDQVVSLDLSFGTSTMIVFEDDEKIETLAAGDALGFKIEPNKRGNVLFVKPSERGASANLNVLTNKRQYVFFLRSDFRHPRNQIFAVRFTYPDTVMTQADLAEARKRAAEPNLRNLDVANVNSDYAYKGSPANKPSVVFDDGVKTFFRFDGNVPAIFIVDPRRNESLVNFRREGPYIVVDRVNYQWTLRNGEDATCVFNQRLRNVVEPTGLEPYAPRKTGAKG